MSLVQETWAFVEEVLDFLFWREDWNRTWSPVAWWLAALTAVGIVVAVIVLGPDWWRGLSTRFGSR